jgi:hypothetical protein
MIASTSVLAYKEHQATGKTGTQCSYIFDCMQFNKDYSRRELAKLTGLELSSVCGRVNEMLELGMLQENGSRKCEITGKTIHPIIKKGLF